MKDADAKREFRRAMYRNRNRIPGIATTEATSDRDYKIFMLGVAYGEGRVEAPLLIERIIERQNDVEDIT